MNIPVLRWLTVIDTRHEEAGQSHAEALRKVAIVAIVKNPFIPGFTADLQPGIDASAGLGKLFGARLVDAMGGQSVANYGKAGIVGVAGEQEHANALLTTSFAQPIRDAIGGGKSWIPSVTKVASVGTSVDVPLGHKDALYVRSHYDTITIAIPDGPLPDEIALIFAAGNRGRLNARVGGLQHADIRGDNGLN